MLIVKRQTMPVERRGPVERRASPPIQDAHVVADAFVRPSSKSMSTPDRELASRIKAGASPFDFHHRNLR